MSKPICQELSCKMEAEGNHADIPLCADHLVKVIHKHLPLELKKRTK